MRRRDRELAALAAGCRLHAVFLSGGDVLGDEWADDRRRYRDQPAASSVAGVEGVAA